LSTRDSAHGEVELDWSGLAQALGDLNGTAVVLVVDDFGSSRLAVAGEYREVRLPWAECVSFAIGSAVTTVYRRDYRGGTHRTLGDGFFVFELRVGERKLLLGSPDLLATDYELDPFP
jgi:hypothetical protein